jgi:hypothetical protein
MPDVISVFEKFWKRILGVSLFMALFALLINLVVPKKYLSTSTALPVNSVVADRSSIFNQNINGLYSSIGTAEELDKIEGTSRLDTLYLAVVRSLNLTRHYKITSGSEGTMKAVMILRKNTEVSRTGFGELRVKVWDKDREMAALICNSLMNELQIIHSNILLQVDSLKYSALTEEFNLKKKQLDINQDSGRANQFQLQELARFNELLDQYKINLSSVTPALIVVEKARPAIWADKPEIFKVTLVVFFATLIFSFLLMFLMQSRKKL